MVEFLRAALAAGSGGSGLLPRDDPVSDLLVSGSCAGSGHRVFHDCLADGRYAGQSDLRQHHAIHAWHGWAGRLAMAVPARRPTLRADGHRSLALVDGSAGAGTLAR